MILCFSPGGMQWISQRNYQREEDSRSCAAGRSSRGARSDEREMPRAVQFFASLLVLVVAFAQPSEHREAPASTAGAFVPAESNGPVHDVGGVPTASPTAGEKADRTEVQQASPVMEAVGAAASAPSTKAPGDGANDHASAEEREGAPSSAVHALVHLSYGTPAVDGVYQGWEEPEKHHPSGNGAGVLPGRHTPHESSGDDGVIASAFFPARGIYSSLNTTVVDEQLRALRRARVGVAVLAYPGRPGARSTRNQAESPPVDEAVDVFLARAARLGGLRMAFFLLDYPERDALNLRADIAHIVGRWGGHSAIYRGIDIGVDRRARAVEVDAAPHSTSPPEKSTSTLPADATGSTSAALDSSSRATGTGTGRPWVYVHDSYRMGAPALAKVFTPTGTHTIRRTAADVVALGLYYRQHPETRAHNVRAGFDGVHTFFASTGFTEGSRPSSWQDIRQWAASNRMLFVPAVAPGHDDTRVHPWNRIWRRERGGGAYFSEMWRAAIDARADAVLVNSFNGWISGTQIEPARPTNEQQDACATAPRGRADSAPGRAAGCYRGYEPHPPEFYLDQTAEHVRALLERRVSAEAPHDEL